MRFITDLEEDSHLAYDLHATLAQIAADDRVDADEMMTFKAAVAVLGSLAQRIDRKAEDGRHAARLLMYGEHDRLAQTKKSPSVQARGQETNVA
jgi:hypothetical protein